MDPAGRTEIDLAVLIARWLFDSVREPIAFLGRPRLYNCEVVFADLSQENFAGDETNKQFLVLVCGEAGEWAQSSGSACVGPIALARLLAPDPRNLDVCALTSTPPPQR